MMKAGAGLLEKRNRGVKQYRHHEDIDDIGDADIEKRCKRFELP
jgi:hypothetical protein